MTAPTGRRPGRPPAVARKVRLAALDAAPAALEVLVRGVKLGDVQAAEAVIRLALDAKPASEVHHG